MLVNFSDGDISLLLPRSGTEIGGIDFIGLSVFGSSLRKQLLIREGMTKKKSMVVRCALFCVFATIEIPDPFARVLTFHGLQEVEHFLRV